MVRLMGAGASLGEIDAVVVLIEKCEALAKETRRRRGQNSE